MKSSQKCISPVNKYVSYIIKYIPLVALVIENIIILSRYINECPSNYKILTTGASDNHFHLLILFMYRIYVVEKNICVVVWNLGLSDSNVNNLKNAKRKIEGRKRVVIIKTFPYDKYPSHFNIHRNAGQYSWKPFVLWDTYSQYKRDVLWLDTGCFIKNKLDFEYDQLKKKQFYTIGSGTSIQRYTHAELFKILNADISINYKPMCSGGIMGIHYPSKTVENVLSLWKACALIKNCISPPEDLIKEIIDKIKV